MRAHIPLNSKVMAVHAPIAYYAKARYYLFPYAKAPQILRYIKREGIKYIALNSRFKDDVPYVTAWFLGNVPREFKLIHIIEGSTGYRVWVYKVRDT